jgi:hypothetical protein
MLAPLRAATAAVRKWAYRGAVTDPMGGGVDVTRRRSYPQELFF